MTEGARDRFEHLAVRGADVSVSSRAEADVFPREEQLDAPPVEQPGLAQQHVEPDRGLVVRSTYLDALCTTWPRRDGQCRRPRQAVAMRQDKTWHQPFHLNALRPCPTATDRCSTAGV